MSKIALDFDQTFTTDPFAWANFIRNFVYLGHDVRIVTARDGINDGIKWRKFGMSTPPAEIIWCDGRPKREVCRAEGWEPDIWIDDNPAGIVFASSFKDEETLAAWRSQDEYRASTQPIHGRSRGLDYKKDKANDGDTGNTVQARAERPGYAARKLTSVSRA